MEVASPIHPERSVGRDGSGRARRGPLVGARRYLVSSSPGDEVATFRVARVIWGGRPSTDRTFGPADAGRWTHVDAGSSRPMLPQMVGPDGTLAGRYRIDGPLASQLEATVRLDAQGKPLQQDRVAFDAWGRPTRGERISSINGKASNQSQKPEVVLRAEYLAMPQNLQSTQLAAAQYAALWRPTLVARPSVVASREHRWPTGQQDV